MKLRKVNDEVYYAEDLIVRFGRDEIEFVKRQAAASPRGRARICAHRDPADRLHEMLIALAATGYVRPHKHMARAESFQVFEGAADVVVFDDAGGIEDVVRMSNDDGSQMYRLNVPRFHTVLVRSDFFVVHETTVGPFDRADTIFAPWSPADDAVAEIGPFLKRLERQLAACAATRPT